MISRGYYDIKDSFPFKQLFVRSEGSCPRIYLVSKSTQQIFEADRDTKRLSVLPSLLPSSSPPLSSSSHPSSHPTFVSSINCNYKKVISMGLRLFGSHSYNDALCPYRLNVEGLLSLYPFMKFFFQINILLPLPS